MKSYKVILLSLALAAGFITPVLRADATAPAKEHEKAEKTLRGVDKVADELGLNADQTAKFKSIRKEEIAALKVVTEDHSLERAAKIAKNKEIHETFKAQRRAVLTPEQLPKFEAHLKAAKSGGADKDKE